jgi:hypothetical protein
MMRAAGHRRIVLLVVGRVFFHAPHRASSKRIGDLSSE